MAAWPTLAGALLLACSVSGCTTSAAPSTAAGGGPGGGGGGRGRGAGGGAVPVVAAAVLQRDVPVEVEAIGNVEAYSSVSIKPQVSGQLTQVHFHEGDMVKENDALFTVDPRPYQAALQQAQANDVRNRALLSQAEATLNRDIAQAEYAREEVNRFGHLFERGLVSREQADQAKSSADATAASVKADQAAVESARAQVAAGEAAVETARLQLGYTVIRSPLTGRTGNVSVKAGNIVTANTTELTTIAQIQPAYVTFSVPAVHLPAIKRYMATGNLAVKATPQDQDATSAEGSLTFVDNAVDSSTDTIKLKATFQNGDRRLWPGQFANVVLRLTTVKGALVVPNEAVQTGQDGQYLFVVRPNATVEQRTVTIGSRVDQDVVIEQGVRAGETVVTEGQLRLEPGTRVQVGAGQRGGPGRGGRGGPGGGQGGRRGRPT